MILQGELVIELFEGSFVGALYFKSANFGLSKALYRRVQSEEGKATARLTLETPSIE